MEPLVITPIEVSVARREKVRAEFYLHIGLFKPRDPLVQLFFQKRTRRGNNPHAQGRVAL